MPTRQTIGNDKLTELSTIAVQLVKDVETINGKVDALAEKFDEFKDGRINTLENKVAVLERNVDMLQKVVYGLITMATVQFLGGGTAVLLWLIKR